MNCIKCGREISANQVFCDECLTDMERHPVNPGTPVLLPPREKRAPAKRSGNKRTLKPEEQIAAQRTLIRWLLVLILVLIAALSFMVAALLHTMDNKEEKSSAGQNVDYSIAADCSLF